MSVPETKHSPRALAHLAKHLLKLAERRSTAADSGIKQHVEALRKYPWLEDMTENNLGLLAALEPNEKREL
jgi:hypothetical protein